MALVLNLDTDALRDLLGGRLRCGAPRRVWNALRDPRFAGPHDVAVLGARIPLSVRRECAAGLKILSPRDPGDDGLEVEAPEAALATLVRFLGQKPVPDAWWSPDEVVARFGEIARFSRIHRQARIGDGTRIGAGVVVHAGVQVGDGCVLGDQVVLGSEGFGLAPSARGNLDALPHRAGVVLGADVQVGTGSNIAAGLLEPTWIGSRARIDALVQVGHNCRVGEGCVLAGQVGLAGSVELGPGCLVGGQAGFADHVHLGAGCRVAGQAGVTRSWPEKTALVGFPARPRGEWLREQAHSVPARRTHSSTFSPNAGT